LAQTEDAVILLIDHSGPSYLAALDKRSGQTKWKQDRSPRVSWSSPVVATGASGPEILISSNGVAQSHSAATGELLWEVTELKGNTVASPSVTRNEVLIGSGDPGQSMLIRRDGRGNVSQSHIAWRAQDASSSFGSPLVHEGRAYFVNKAGVAFALGMATGETLWTARLPDSAWASPVAAGDRVYFFCKNGATVVVRPSDKLEKLAENSLTVQSRLYGVAVAGDSFLLRDGRRLVCVRE
jgi:outer membrane protein assembly factor BamB